VHRASRVSDSGHGGQVVVSDVTAQLVESALPADVRLEALGRYQLAGFPEPAALYQVTAPGLEDDFPVLRARPAESKLPVPLTEFIGREDEIEAGRRILDQHRLLTLTGPGGTGKTRLALEIARRSEPLFGDGAYLVPFAALTDADLIPMTLLETLDLKIAGGVDPLDHLMRYLSQRHVLMVLDNFEQLLEGAGIVADLLKASPRLSLVVTSRTPLRLSGERELPVPPLNVPGAEADTVTTIASTDGVRLFVERAAAVRPDFSLTEDNARAVAAITRALDGLPLAIELAASRLRTLAPDAILDRLGNQLLTSRSTDRPERQQTIINAISWSYDLLDDASKRLFEEVSVFSGSFGLVEAESVIGEGFDVLDGLTELVEHSLVRTVASTDEPRFRMLTVIREFAYAALVASGRDRQLLERHSMTYLQLARTANEEILTSRQADWLHRLSQDHDNIRAAFDHAVIAGDAKTALGLAGSMWRFWQMRGHLAEGIDRTEMALAMEGDVSPTDRAHALTGLGGLLYWLGDWQATKAPYIEALELLRVDGSHEEMAEALYNAAFPIGHEGDFDRAVALLRESLELSERVDRSIGVGRAMWGIGNMESYLERWEEAVGHVEKSIEIFSTIDAPFDLGWAWFMLAHCHQKTANSSKAREPLRHALDIFSTVEDLSAMSLILYMVGVVRLNQGSEGDAAYFAGATIRLKSDTGIALGDVDLNRYPEMADFIEGLDTASNPEYQEGYNATLEEIVEKARHALIAD
ncbi:MAG TPA: tetratricopeptide repeat protein, partial [Acidimicrobiia bacterium]